MKFGGESEVRTNGKLTRTYILEVARNNERPVRLLVNRDESYRCGDNNQITDASINISYERLKQKENEEKASGTFVGSYHPHYNLVSLSSLDLGRGAIHLDLPGLHSLRLGTYFFSEIIQWGKQWPDATIKQMELLALQGSPENRIRRNKMYLNAGIMIDWHNLDCVSGTTKETPVSSLKVVDTWTENISEMELATFLNRQEKEIYKLSTDLELSAAALECRNEAIRNFRRQPIRSALRIMGIRF